MDIKHSISRKTFELGVDGVMKYLNKDRDEHMQNLINMAQKITGSTYPSYVFDNARELFADKDAKWTKFTYKTMDELDPNIVKMHVLNLGYETALCGMKQLAENRKKYGINIPWVILMDPTSACNLKCIGCWAAEYGHREQLTFEDLDRIVTQGKELGIHFYIMTGGEPLVRRDDIIKLAKKHNDCAYHIFTNGTLIDEKFAKEVKKVGNISFAISVEGYAETNDSRRGQGVFDKVMKAMDIMKAEGLLYGVSICYTSKNIDVVTSDEFLDMLIDKGCRIAWYFHYMPVGNDAAVELLPTPEQREYMFHRVREIRGMKGGKPIFAMDFQNDGQFVGGCIAGGKNYLHINPHGDVEPCVFIHYSSANIKEMSLLDALKQPLFRAYKENMPFNKNLLKPCPMLENPERLLKMVHDTRAKSTDMQSPESVDSLCAKTKPYAEGWSETADKLWENEMKIREEKKKAREKAEAAVK